MMDRLAVVQTDSQTLNHTISLARGIRRFQHTPYRDKERSMGRQTALRLDGSEQGLAPS